MKQYIGTIEVKSPRYKKYAALLSNYKYATNRHGYRMVHDCYEKPSEAKDEAENRIWWEMKQRNGYGYAVIGYNAMMFTAGYLFPHPVDGNLILCYETRDSTYYIDAAGL